MAISETIPSLGSVPQTSDPANFDARADTLLGTALPAFRDSVNTWAGQANSTATTINANAVAAAASEVAAGISESNAAASAAAADATANATVWVSGEVIAEGDNRYSPTNFLTYRANKALSSGANTVDPSANATDWVSLGASPAAFIQLVNSTSTATATGATTTPFDNTIPQITEGTQFLSVSITPTSATNVLVFDIVMVLESSTSPAYTTLALFVDFKHRMVACSTSAMTFTVRAGTSAAGTLRLNGYNSNSLYNGVCSSSITVSEVAP
jgi:hypothetical protein